MNSGNDRGSAVPGVVQARLESRLAPFRSESRVLLEDLDVGAAPAVAPKPHRRAGFVDDLKLLLAALGAGNRVVPLGDNRAAARELAEYAKSLCRN